jgi:[citrate (pro-3S)-lyase] ligase
VFEGYETEIADLKNPSQVEEIRRFLAGFDLSFDSDVEYTVNFRLGGRLVGTGSFAGEVLRNIAVDESAQGSGLTATIVSHLMQEAARRGRLHYFIFTRPAKAYLFEALGFREIARAEPHVALLETGIGSIDSYCREILRQTAHLKGERSAVVVNCNPFTKGHRALIERAACESDSVIVFVVSEDKSLFPFADRLSLVKAGVADLANVAVFPAGPYIISAATFPTYFTREEDKVAAQTQLDIVVFATRIAPELGIKTRYVGEEPYCEVTHSYNQAMLDILPLHGIKVKVIQRVAVDGDIVSASKVRDMIRQDDWDGIQKVVPESTYRYLTSDSAKDILAKIKNSVSRH